MQLSTIFKLYRGGGGNRSTRWKPQACRKSLTSFIAYNVVSSTPCYERETDSQTLVVLIVVIKMS